MFNQENKPAISTFSAKEIISKYFSFDIYGWFFLVFNYLELFFWNLSSRRVFLRCFVFLRF